MGAFLALALETTFKLNTLYYIFIWGALTLLSGLILLMNFLFNDSILNWIFTGNFESISNEQGIEKFKILFLQFDWKKSPLFHSFWIIIALAIVVFLILLFLRTARDASKINIDDGRSPTNIVLAKARNFLKLFLSFIIFVVAIEFLIILISSLMIIFEIGAQKLGVSILGSNKNVFTWNDTTFNQAKNWIIFNFTESELKDKIKLIKEKKLIDVNSSDFKIIFEKLGGENSEPARNFLAFINTYNNTFFDSNILKNEEWDKVFALLNNPELTYDNVIKTSNSKFLVENQKYITQLNYWIYQISQLQNGYDGLNNNSSIISIINNVDVNLKQNLNNLLDNSQSKGDNLFEEINKLFENSFRDIINNSNVADGSQRTKSFLYALESKSFSSLNGDLASNLPTYLFRLERDNPNLIFVPGWSGSDVAISLFSQSGPPASFLVPLTNITISGPSNVKLLLFGGMLNVIVLTGVISFVYILIKRIVFIITWPWKNIYSLIISSYDDGELLKEEFRELVDHFFQILVIMLFWALFEKILFPFWNGLTSSSGWLNMVQDHNSWQNFILKSAFIAGAIHSLFHICNNFMKKISRSSSPIAEASRAAQVGKSSISNSRRSIHRINSQNRRVSQGLSQKSSQFFKRQPLSNGKVSLLGKSKGAKGTSQASKAFGRWKSVFGRGIKK